LAHFGSKELKDYFHVMLYEYLPPTDGGIAQAAWETALEFQRRGLKTALSGFKDLFRDPIYKTTKIDLFGLPRKGWKSCKDIYMLLLCFRLLFKYGNKVVFYSQTWKTARTTFFFARLFGWRSVLFAHGNEVTRQIGGKKERLMKRTFEGADFVFANSNYTASRLNEIGVSSIVNKLGVNIQRYIKADSAVCKERFGWFGKKIVLTAARVVPRKGQDFVISTLPQICKHIPDLLYVIAGGGEPEEIKRLQLLARENNVADKVVFTGYVDEETKLALYNACDLYVMISKSLNDNKDIEGFGITFLEANCCEKVVIGSNAGGIPDAIESGASGFIISPNDNELFVKYVCTLLENDKMRNEMGLSAKMRVQNEFTWEKYVDRLFLEIVDS